jgi:hypothetical protein
VQDELRIPPGVLGYEYDTIFNNGKTPKGLTILAESPVVNIYHERENAYSAYYRAKSGALVFDAGTIWWCYGLDSLTVPGSEEDHPFPADQAISDLTLTLLQTMLSNVPGETPAPSFDIPSTIGG